MAIILGALQTVNPNGVFGTSWRHPENTSLGYLTIPYWTEMGQLLERGGFDFLFFADSYSYPSVPDGELIKQAVTDATNFPLGDPITLVSAIAAATQTLSVVVTASTTVERAPSVARRYGTLDHLTGGRIGWNVVTGAAQATSAKLFGEAPTPREERYAQAEDHISICLRLWEGSWDDGALIADKQAGVYGDADRVRQVAFDGQYLSMDGAYGLPPSPQRTPLIMQAGASDSGRDFAAKYAELVFIGGSDHSHVAAQIADIRARAAAHGRDAESVKFVVGAHFVVGADDAEAERKHADMLTYMTREYAATEFMWNTGVDLLAYPIDEPLPDLQLSDGQSTLETFQDPARGRRATPREIMDASLNRQINGTMFVGDGKKVADRIEDFLAKTGADGFLVRPFIAPGTYEDIVEHLTPELVERGLMEPNRSTDTLRARLFAGSDGRLPSTHPGAAFRHS
jgi:FMN-dependent oxidoreductase (nitrilotriacetate monooxygenase family)